jgi:hypothetical protein
MVIQAAGYTKPARVETVPERRPAAALTTKLPRGRERSER